MSMKAEGIKPLRILSGGLPDPDELIGREKIINRIEEDIKDCNILLLSPRRFGKSGILNYFIQKGIGDFIPLYIFVEEINEPVAFLNELIKAIMNTKGLLKKVLAQIPKLPRKSFNWFKKQGRFIIGHFEWKPGKDEEMGWEELGNILFHTLEKHEKPFVLMIDEFPRMIERFHEKEIDTFLSWFRTCRVNVKKELRKHRFILTGSIGINYLLRQTRNTDTLNDCIRHYVGEISKKDAHILFKGLYHYQFNEVPDKASINTFFKILDCRVPFFIHLFFHQIMQHPEGSIGEFSMLILERVFWRDLLGNRCKAYFDQYKDRFSRYGKERKKVAELILKKIIREKDFSIKRTDLLAFIKYQLKDSYVDDQVFNDIMGDLEVEWYVSLENPEVPLNEQRYIFQIPLLARWWNRFYPALES